MLKAPFKRIAKKVSFLILDYSRPQETATLLNSIKRHVKFNDYEVIYLSNGGDQTYVPLFYKSGLIDKCILSKKNEGSGLGTLRLTEFCQSPYFINLQCDNYLIRPFEECELNLMIDLLSGEVGAIDFTELKPFSERAFMMDTEFYCSNPLQEGGGTGPEQGLSLKGTEQATYEWIIQNNKSVYCWPNLIGDSGKYAIIEVGKGVLERRCDTQELKVWKTPKSSMPLWNLTDEEWKDILEGKWKDWRIPEKSKKWVFHLFSQEFEDPENEIYRIR